MPWRRVLRQLSSNYERLPAGMSKQRRGDKRPGVFELLECSDCGMYESVLFSHEGKEMCRLCWVHELRRRERKSLSEVLEILWDKWICAYCGEPAGEREHVVARCHNEPTWLVPTCRECNAVAGGKLFYTFVEKRTYIHERLRKKYSSVLRTAEFDREELAEMGPGLRGLIRSASTAREIIRQRLGFELELAGLRPEQAKDVSRKVGNR